MTKPQLSVSALEKALAAKSLLEKDGAIQRYQSNFEFYGMLRAELEENSKLPFRVDLVFKDQISDEFLSLIKANFEKW